MVTHKKFFNLDEIRNIKNCFIHSSEKVDGYSYALNGKILVNRNGFAGEYNQKIKKLLHDLTGFKQPTFDVYVTLFDGGSVDSHKDYHQFKALTLVKKAIVGGEFIVGDETINLDVGDLFLFDAGVEHLVTPAFGGYEVVSFGFFKGQS